MTDSEKAKQQMEETCVPCLGYRIKKSLVSELGDSVAEKLKKIPTCEDPLAINLCENTPRERVSKPKKTRKPSEYQLFVGECMRERHSKGFDPNAMKNCAEKWRLRKSAGQG